MILSKEYFNSCDPSYQQIIRKLEDEIAEINAKFLQNDVGNSDAGDNNIIIADDEEEDTNEKGKEIRELMMKYSKICMLPKAYWKYCISNISSGAIFNFNDKNTSNAYDEITAEAAYHFYYDPRREQFRQRDGSKKRLLKFVNEMNFGFGHYAVTESDLSYPHSHLSSCFEYYESHALTPPSKEIGTTYLKMKELYSKIKSAENDVEKWLSFLAETNGHQFVADNVEYRLFINLQDKTLWKCYINFLSQNGLIKEMLESASRYCRFFTDDQEMKQKYKLELEKYGKPINLKWSNLFDFEVGFAKTEDVEKENNESRSDEKCKEMDIDDEKPIVKKNNDKMAPSLDRALCKQFFNKSAAQSFDFRSTTINYIFANAKPSLLQKLQKCCKHFYVKKMIPLCYLLKATSSPTAFKEQSLYLKYNQKREAVLKKTFIFGSIIAKTDGFHFIPPNFISTCIPLLYRCTAKHVILEKQNLSFAELKFLVGSGNVVQFKMSSGKITGENGKWIQLEDILELLPNIEALSLPSLNVSKSTPARISNLTFLKKLFSFSIFPILGEPFDATEFLRFFIKIRDPENFSLSLAFHHLSFNDEFVNAFEKIMIEYKKECKNGKTEMKVFHTNDAMLED